MFSRVFFNRDVYEIRWKNIAELATSRMTTWRVRIRRWIPKAKDTHSKHLILTASPRQQWLRESASLLRHTYYAYLANSHFLQYENVTNFDGGNDITNRHHKYIM